MNKSRTSFFILILAFLFCTAAMADTGIPWVESIWANNIEEASIWVNPDGSGPSLVNALYFGGYDANATIEVRLVDDQGYAIANFPWEDIWLDPETDTASSCYGINFTGFPADSNTDANGMTTFTLPLRGGGWTEGPIWVYLNGSRAMDPGWNEHAPVPLRFNSPDLNSDGVVNLTDVALFAGDYFGAYHYRSDYWWDGVLNLSDLVNFSEGYGTYCE